MNAAPRPVCEILVPLEGEYADFLRESPHVAFVFRKGENDWVAIERLLFHWTMKVGEVGDRFGYRTRYCYATAQLALAAAAEWAERNFEGEPKWWHRNPETGRRREGGDATKEEIRW
jgi:hypothetical protein